MSRFFGNQYALDMQTEAKGLKTLGFRQLDVGFGVEVCSVKGRAAACRISWQQNWSSLRLQMSWRQPWHLTTSEGPATVAVVQSSFLSLGAKLQRALTLTATMAGLWSCLGCPINTPFQGFSGILLTLLGAMTTDELSRRPCTPPQCGLTERPSHDNQHARSSAGTADTGAISSRSACNLSCAARSVIVRRNCMCMRACARADCLCINHHLSALHARTCLGGLLAFEAMAKPQGLLRIGS